MTAVNLYRDLAHADLAGHLLVHQSGSDEGHHLELARREHFELGLELGHAFFLLPPLAVALQRIGDGIQEILIAERLGEEIDGARLHRSYRHGDIAMGGDEDDRDLDIGIDQLGLEIEPAALRQPDIAVPTQTPRREASRKDGSSSTTRTTGSSGGASR